MTEILQMTERHRVIKPTQRVKEVTKMSKNFIRCSDAETIAKMKNLGFIVYSEKNGVTTFINEQSKPLGFEEQKNILYTNKIEV